MARKRSQKKHQKQAAERLDKLRKFYRTNQDDAFLELSAQVEDLDTAGFAEEYEGVLERHLKKLLGTADLDSIRSLLQQHDLEVDARPITRLATAVLAIDDGDLAQARRLLESLETSAEAVVASDLTHQLLALCLPGTSSTPTDCGQEIGEFLKLRRTIIRYALGELKRLPSNYRLENPKARRLLDFLRGLEKIAPTKDPRPQTLHRIEQAAQDLLEAKPTSERSRALMLGAARLAHGCRSELFTKLPDRRRTDPLESDDTIDELHRRRGEITTLLGPELPSALAPLQYLLRKKYRSVLSHLEKRGGSTALARVWAVVGQGFSSLLALEPEETPIDEGKIETWHTLRGLVEQYAFFELARILHEESGEEDNPSRLVRLWGVELWALREAAEDDSDPFESLLEEESTEAIRALRRRLLRIRTISREIGSRISGGGQQRQIARVLRQQVLTVPGEMMEEKSLPTLTHLLQHLPDDRALLALAFGSALTADQKNLAQHYSGKLKSLGPAPETQIQDLMPIANEPPYVRREGILDFFSGIEPIFGDRWPSIRAEAALFIELRAMANLNAFMEDFGPPVAWIGPTFTAEVDSFRQFLHEDFDEFRPIFGQDISFQVSELVIRGTLDWRAPFESLVEQFLTSRAELEASLACLRWLDTYWRFPGLENRFGKSRKLAITTMVMRLDNRWTLWGRSVEIVFSDLDQPQLKILQNRLHELLTDSALEQHQQLDIELFLDQISARLEELSIRKRLKTKTTKRRSSKKTKSKVKAPKKSTKKLAPKGNRSDGQLSLFDLGSQEIDNQGLDS